MTTKPSKFTTLSVTPAVRDEVQRQVRTIAVGLDTRVTTSELLLSLLKLADTDAVSAQISEWHQARDRAAQDMEVGA